MKRLLFAVPFALSVTLLGGGCLSPTDAPETAAESDAEIAVETAGWDVFGASFDTATAVPAETVAANPGAYSDAPVRIVGTITEVCQGMGCWMTLQVPDGQNIRVVMPRDEAGNYVFTLDRAISGRKTVVEGTLSHSTLAEFEEPMHEDAHGDEDDGHTESDMHTPEIQLTASGVLVEQAL